MSNDVSLFGFVFLAVAVSCVGDFHDTSKPQQGRSFFLLLAIRYFQAGRAVFDYNVCFYKQIYFPSYTLSACFCVASLLDIMYFSFKSCVVKDELILYINPTYFRALILCRGIYYPGNCERIVFSDE